MGKQKYYSEKENKLLFLSFRGKQQIKHTYKAANSQEEWNSYRNGRREKKKTKAEKIELESTAIKYVMV